ncbi:hypothetical protein M3Y98_01069900 [Aphelenchoides besseyi]|nr:hypothetical protein M3Y98_01069900 [Aphelenchoides besseyi]
MSKQVLSDVRFKSIYREMSVFYVLSSETLRKFMTTTLLMHNFGRSIRTTQKLIDHHCQKAHLLNHKKKNNTNGKYMKIACHQDDLYSRERYTIGYKDLWTLVSLENFRCCLMSVLTVSGIVVNCYMLFLLKIAYLSANRTFVQLAIMFSLSNLLFLIVNAWMISQQFWPVIAEQQTADFFLIENYDGDLFWNATYFAAASGLRLIMNNRYAHNPEDFNSSSQTWILHLLLVGEDLLLNCSRSIGAIILLLLMYNLLYELRASFCGRLSYKLLTSVKIAIAAVFLFLIAMYIGICVIEIATIDQLNEFLQAKPSDEDELKENCAAIKRQESFAPLLKSHAYFMCMFYILTLLLIVTLFVYHRFKIYKSVFPIPPQLQIEMNGVLMSLAFVSFTYILSNFGTTYVEASCGPNKLLSAEEIANLTLKYHWLCLIKFLDPILHPLILMKRMRVLRQIDLVWRSNFRLSSIFNATSGLSEFPVQRTVKTLKPKKSTYGWTGTSIPPNTKQAIDRELGSMLRILEEQRLGIHQ